jgi:hypothetical protein
VTWITIYSRSNVRRVCNPRLTLPFKLFSVGLLFAPIAILLHELGHWFALAALGCPAQLHFAYTTPGTAIPHSSWFVVAAGPAITAVMMFGGFFLLLRLRRARLQGPATRVDWLATFSALCALRWLRFGTASMVLPQPSDEATLSMACGFPSWLLPFLLVPVALTVFVSTIRLHPSGNRLAPFASAVLGICVGVALWLKVIGPRLLP